MNLIHKSVSEVVSLGIPIRIVKNNGEFAPKWKKFEDGKRNVHVFGGYIIYEDHRPSFK